MTPLGAVKVFVNDNAIEFTAIKMDNLDSHCPGVNGRFLIQYEFKNQFGSQEIKCCIPSLDVKGEIESGERLEAISFYKGNIKLTIGAAGEFNDHPKYINYSGDYLEMGFSIQHFKIQQPESLSLAFVGYNLVQKKMKFKHGLVLIQT